MSSSAELSLRPATAADAEFLFRLFATTRADEMRASGWPAAQQESFLRSQYEARQRSYAASFPSARPQIALIGGTAVGALIVHRGPEAIRLVDLALLPAWRGQGLGTRLLHDLQAEARQAGRPLRLQVLKGNPARQLYTRLGFAPAGENGLYLRMEWSG